MRRLASILLLTFALGGCSVRSPSVLHPAGFGAERVETLWWLLFGISLVVFAVVTEVVVWALLRRKRQGAVTTSDPRRFVVIVGAVLPFIILVAVYGFNLRDLGALARPPGGEDPAVTVDVIGHRWWWEVRYPDTAAVTANEVHIPVGRPVLVRLSSADVIHSFWVPQLMPKTDMIPGQLNETWLQADRAGNYRGQCAEYCGIQHAHMALMVVAQEPADFAAWLAGASGAAQSPQTPLAQGGQQLFLGGSCAGCHTIRGTTAQGTVAPDLTQIGARWSIGAGAAPMDEEHLRAWISNPQQFKPGSGMPPQAWVAGASGDLAALVAYLQSLR